MWAHRSVGPDLADLFCRPMPRPATEKNKGCGASACLLSAFVATHLPTPQDGQAELTWVVD